MALSEDPLNDRSLLSFDTFTKFGKIYTINLVELTYNSSHVTCLAHSLEGFNSEAYKIL